MARFTNPSKTALEILDARQAEIAAREAAREKPSALDVQEGGDHYKTMPIQPVEFMLANGLGYCEGNVIKYVCRWKHKNGVEDLKKARHYLDLLIESAISRGNQG